VVSRIHRTGTLQVPQPETELKLGDVLLAVGTPEELESLRVVVGRASGLDLRSLPSPITSRRLIVTRPEASGHSIDQLDAVHRFGVQVTRVGRAEVEMAPQPGLELQYGDTVLAVGEPAGLDKLAAELGDSPKKLDYPHLAPMFLGIALGVALGQWPMHLPGLPAPVKLGLAGGPLLVAMALSRIGRMGPLVWYMPISANYMLRQVGIVLFLAAVGLKAGGHFVETLVAGPGLTWLFCGSAITLVPLLLAAAVGRLVLKLNYLPLCGVLAGSMTDPPALSFATSLVGSEGPALAYATVYPLATILRVLLAQVLVRTLVG
jgi:putative transport protein